MYVYHEPYIWINDAIFYEYFSNFINIIENVWIKMLQYLQLG